jgi:hypothetical protein
LVSLGTGHPPAPRMETFSERSQIGPVTWKWDLSWQNFLSVFRTWCKSICTWPFFFLWTLDLKKEYIIIVQDQLTTTRLDKESTHSNNNQGREGLKTEDRTQDLQQTKSNNKSFPANNKNLIWKLSSSCKVSVNIKKYHLNVGPRIIFLHTRTPGH